MDEGQVVFRMDDVDVSVKAEPGSAVDAELLKEEPEIAQGKIGGNDENSEGRPEARTDTSTSKTEDVSADSKHSPVKSSGDENMRAVFVGNFPPAFTVADIEKLFEKHGPVARVDKKQNFAFVFMRNVENAERAIVELGGKSIGRPPRTLRVEWSRGDGKLYPSALHFFHFCYNTNSVVSLYFLIM